MHDVIECQVPGLLNGKNLHGFLATLNALSVANHRVLVLRGSTTDFCLGMDLNSITPDSFEERAVVDFARVLQFLTTTPLITVAVIDGKVLGGGVGIAAACDWVIATGQADFSLPELVLGLIPAIILPVLVERIGSQPAKRWLLSQAHWPTAMALQMGLVDQQIDGQRLDIELKRTLRQLLRSQPMAIAKLKQWLNDSRQLNRFDAIEQGQQRLHQLLADAAVRDNIIAFRDHGLLPETRSETHYTHN